MLTTNRSRTTRLGTASTWPSRNTSTAGTSQRSRSSLVSVGHSRRKAPRREWPCWWSISHRATSCCSQVILRPKIARKYEQKQIWILVLIIYKFFQLRDNLLLKSIIINWFFSLLNNFSYAVKSQQEPNSILLLIIYKLIQLRDVIPKNIFFTAKHGFRCCKNAKFYFIFRCQQDRQGRCRPGIERRRHGEAR